ncbi:hypothetical protein D3C81_1748080 [compost metagenome]
MLRQACDGDVGRVALLRCKDADLRHALLDQVDNVGVFRRPAAQFGVRIAGSEATYHRALKGHAVTVGHHHRHQRLYLFGQPDRQRIEPGAGIEDRLDVGQDLAAGLIQGGVAACTVEQFATYVSLEVGDCDADGRLALAQFARCGGKRAKGCGFDKGNEGFR